MTMLLLVISIPLALAVVPGYPFLGSQGVQSAFLPNVEDTTSWISQSLCVLQMGNSCPSGFSSSDLRLSVQPDVNPKASFGTGALQDKNVAGEDLMHLGDAGSSSLHYDTYDRLYTLNLAVCCRS